jgi:phosphonate transport system substrate-binding protein
VSRRRFLHTGAALAAGVAAPALLRAQNRTLRFGVGPFLPTAGDTRKAYTPFFAHLARELGAADHQLAVTTDWAGLAVAMGSGHLDLAWMGPWGYVLANAAAGCQAIATVKYDGKPTYHAIIVARPGLPVARFPDDTRGRSISFADVGSTSGWLIPHYYAKTVWQIDPREFWKYNEGAAHPANEIAVQAGQVDLATDFDRNRNAMIAAGRLQPEGTRVIWQSDPLPNDAIAVARDLPPELATRAQQVMLSITEAQAPALLPPRYTGFVAATHESYATIERAGLVLGRLKKS